MGNERDSLIDSLRGLAIFLVVIGHSIQFGNGSAFLHQSLYFENGLFQVIYGFHMPLFMVISGYLFGCSLGKKKPLTLVKSRVTGLLVPILLWGLVEFFLGFFSGKPPVGDTPLGILPTFLDIVLNSLWFLWAVFYNSLVVLVIHKYLKNHWIAYLGVGLLLFVLPDKWSLAPTKFMYPYFILPILLSRVDPRAWLQSRPASFLTVVGLVATLGYVVCMVFWRSSFYIYTSGFMVHGSGTLRQLVIDLIRWGVGFVGITAVLALAHLLEQLRPRWVENPVLVQLGRNSLGIYIISSLLFTFVVSPLTSTFTFNWVGTLIVALLTTLASWLVSLGLSRVSLLNRLLLGGRK